MASYSVGKGQIAAHDKVLVASTADTITFAEECEFIEVQTDGTAKVYFTVDGTTATVSGQECFVVPAITVLALKRVRAAGATKVSIVSAGTPTYSVTRVD